MGKICGIDLGTTFSAISIYDPKSNEVITVPDEFTSENTVPSLVYFPENNELPIVGEAAKNMAAQAPERLVRNIKKNMGEDYKFKLDGKEYTPEEISAAILKQLKNNAEIYLAEEVDEVVVTVPAYFGDRERKATADAVSLAGMKLIRLLTEPSAAALAYSIEKIGEIADKLVLVYDLGGGTFDATLIETSRKSTPEGKDNLNIRTICKDGSRQLGGTNWDEKLVNYLADECQQKFGHNPCDDIRTKFTLIENAIKCKHHLSRFNDYEVVIDAQGNTIKVTRDKFEELTAGLLLQTENKINDVLEMAKKENIQKDEIDVVLLAGGATIMPMVVQMLTRVFGKEPKPYKNVHLIVSHGAAYAAQIAGIDMETGLTIRDKVGREITLKDEYIVDVGKAVGVTVAIKNPDGTKTQKNFVVIPEGTPAGEEKLAQFATMDDNQVAVEFAINEGDAEDLAHCQRMAQVTMVDLPPNRPAGRPLELTLKYDQSGIIVGKGRDVETGKEVEIKIERQKIKSL